MMGLWLMHFLAKRGERRQGGKGARAQGRSGLGLALGEEATPAVGESRLPSTFGGEEGELSGVLFASSGLLSGVQSRDGAAAIRDCHPPGRKASNRLRGKARIQAKGKAT